MPDVTMTANFIDGSVITAQGFIDIQSWESQENKLTLTMFPRNNQWTVVGALTTDLSGTLKSVVISGVTYYAMGDANLDLQPAEYKNEVVMTSAGNVIRKQTRQSRDLKNVVIKCNATERETLRTIAET